MKEVKHGIQIYFGPKYSSLFHKSLKRPEVYSFNVIGKGKH